MSQIRPNDHRPALVEFAQLEFLFALWRFQKNQLLAPPGSVAPGFLQAEHVFVKRHRLLQILHPIAGV